MRADIGKGGITLAEVQKHKSAKDCWMAIDGTVCNLPRHAVEMARGVRKKQLFQAVTAALAGGQRRRLCHSTDAKLEP